KRIPSSRPSSAQRCASRDRNRLRRPRSCHEKFRSRVDSAGAARWSRRIVRMAVPAEDRARRRARSAHAHDRAAWGTRRARRNRALGGLEPEARVRSDRRAFAVGPVTPLVVRGPTPVLSWTPTRIPPATEDTMARLLDLYHHTDVELARVLEGRRDLSILARAG